MVDFNFESTEVTTGFNFIWPNENNFEFTDENLAPETNYEFDFDYSTVTLFILKSPSNLFSSIWCDPNASLMNGRFYLGHEKDLTIINNKNGQAYVEDYYSKTVQGSTKETLKTEGVVDINVAF